MLFSKMLKTVVLAAALLPTLPAHAAEKVRIGYWSSGVSLGFGAVLEASDFFKDQGLDVEYVRFPDVNAPLRALASNSIDLAFGAPAAGVFSSAAEGVPVKIFAATQPADVLFVVPKDSSISSLGQFRDKKIGMSPAGSSVAVIAGAILSGNHGISTSDFSLVGGNEARLVQFLAQKQVDGAALRAVTVAQFDELDVTPLGSFADEWQRLTNSKTVPYIGVGTVRTEYAEQHPKAVAGVIAGLRNAVAWGNEHPDEAAAIMQKAANLPEQDARAYAARWNSMYHISFEPEDIATLKRQHEVFLASGMIKGSLDEALFDAEPYTLSKSLK